MYNPHPFKIEDHPTIEKFIAANGFATLVSSTAEFPYASHIPLILEKKEAKHILIGHISRANHQVKILEKSPKVLAVFYGAQGYISSYAKDPENLSILPTWDYQIVQARGDLKFMNEEELREALYKLVGKYERDQPKSINLADYPSDVFRKKMKGIIGFEIEVTQFYACFRLNQNRTIEERGNIKHRLKVQGNEDLIKAIRDFNKD